MGGIVFSIFLFVVGLITKFALSPSARAWGSSFVRVDTFGLILIWVGLIGFVFSSFWAFWSEGDYFDEYDRIVDKKPDEEPEIYERRRSRKKKF